MIDEKIWMMVIDAVRVIAQKRGIAVPADLVQTTGDMFERHDIRMTALRGFCQEAGLTLPDGASQEAILDALDDLALRGMLSVSAVTEASARRRGRRKIVQ